MVSTYNLILHQGATYRRQFLINHYLLVVESISSSNYIQIAPLAISLPVGTVLKFANGTTTTTTIYQPGEEIINVVTTNFEIKKCERVAAAPVDFTGYTFESQIRSDYEAPILSIVGVSNPVLGILQLDIDWHQTALIPSNITSVDLPRNPQHKDQFNLAATSANPDPYVWQLFGTSGNTRDRLIEGRVLVTPDV